MTAHDPERAIAERLAALPKDADPRSDLWHDIAARIRSEPVFQRGSTLVQLAAASVIFAVGLGTGLAVSGGAPQPSVQPSAMAAMQLAAEVQRTGTEYVAALAAFASAVDSLSADARRQGREAAIAALLGAAKEWADLSGVVPEDLALYRTISSERDEVATVRF